MLIGPNIQVYVPQIEMNGSKLCNSSYLICYKYYIVNINYLINCLTIELQVNYWINNLINCFPIELQVTYWIKLWPAS